MDLINNLVFTATTNVNGFGPLAQNYFANPALLNNPAPQNRGNYFSYNLNVLETFCAMDDAEYIENSIQKHWADMVARLNYTDNANNVVTSFVDPNNANVRTPLYHLVYAYLIENTRAVQIFERLIHMYQHDEKLKKATGSIVNQYAFRWIQNTEDLFFKHLANTSYRNLRSDVRPSSDATRRNAYFRLLGMDLGFGNSTNNAPVDFYKAEANNQPFIMLFEHFLIEVWQAYTNARNQVGANTTDMFSIVDTARKIQEMLMARRTTENNFNNYRYFNLSKEEYSSVVLASWIYFVLSYNSPIVEFLRCNGNTPGERLINIGNKVGLAAHSKSEALLDMAPPMNTLLRRIELGDYNPPNELQVRRIIQSQSQLLNPIATPVEQATLNELLLIINNWEKATGHRIKNPEANITGTVKLQSSPALNKPRPVLN